MAGAVLPAALTALQQRWLQAEQALVGQSIHVCPLIDRRQFEIRGLQRISRATCSDQLRYRLLQHACVPEAATAEPLKTQTARSSPLYHATFRRENSVSDRLQTKTEASLLTRGCMHCCAQPRSGSKGSTLTPARGGGSYPRLRLPTQGGTHHAQARNVHRALDSTSSMMQRLNRCPRRLR